MDLHVKIDTLNGNVFVRTESFYLPEVQKISREVIKVEKGYKCA